jgi:hypothetical protein
MSEGRLRIVSLVPSLTELLCDLGLAGSVVGRTGYCVHPAEIVAAIPKVGGTKQVNLKKVRALAPTHLVVNVDENEKATVDALREHVGEVVVTHPIEVADNLALYRRFGDLFDRRAQAAVLAGRLEQAMAAVRDAAFAPREVVYLIWKDPWMTVSADTYIAKMLAAVGLHVRGPASPQRYPALDWRSFDFGEVSAVLLPSEPYHFTDADAQALQVDPLLGGRPCRLIDGEMVSWYGSRAVAGLAYLSAWRRELDRRHPVAAGAGA